MERSGYSPIGYFPLPRHCWLDNFYWPMQQRFPAFLAQRKNSDAARAIVASEEQEMAIYETYAAFFGYGYFIARKVGI
ncbi:MAG: hypothetical protein R3E68_06070 [Burkholderiaceae bacterium]